MPDIHRISVSLPVLSTAILPDAQPDGSGQNTGMGIGTILLNIERRLAVLKISADEAARLAGRPDAIRNIRRKVRAGAKGSVRADTLAALAAALQTTPEDLMRPATPAAPPVAGLREFLVAQRDLIDRQLADIDAAEFTARKQPKRKIR